MDPETWVSNSSCTLPRGPLVRSCLIFDGYCWWFRNPVNSPVEGTVVFSTIIYKVLAPFWGGWEWDFWSINSIKSHFFWMIPNPDINHKSFGMFQHPDIQDLTWRSLDWNTCRYDSRAKNRPVEVSGLPWRAPNSWMFQTFKFWQRKKSSINTYQDRHNHKIHQEIATPTKNHADIYSNIDRLWPPWSGVGLGIPEPQVTLHPGGQDCIRGRGGFSPKYTPHPLLGGIRGKKYPWWS